LWNLRRLPCPERQRRHRCLLKNRARRDSSPRHFAA
jgi:hypothetical protein